MLARQTNGTKDSGMIYELEQPSSTTLAIDCRFPEALAVMEGNNPGWVFVDDLNAPKAALVWAQGVDGFYLVGDASSAVFRDELDFHTDQVLKPRLQNLGVDCFEISGDEDWGPVIKNALGKRDLEIGQQWVYTLRLAEQKTLTQPKATDGCRLLRVNPHLLVNLSVNNKLFLFSKLTHFWGSVDAFLNTGLGYVLVDEEEIASLCYSGFVAGNIHAIEIETVPSHRRKGYAEAVARAFLAECIEKHLQPHWDCMAENTASSQLAEKLGFTQSYEYTLYSFRL
jgi:GNAT superfamily N-acetyltransferase